MIQLVNSVGFNKREQIASMTESINDLLSLSWLSKSLLWKQTGLQYFQIDDFQSCCLNYIPDFADYAIGNWYFICLFTDFTFAEFGSSCSSEFWLGSKPDGEIGIGNTEDWWTQRFSAYCLRMHSCFEDAMDALDNEMQIFTTPIISIALCGANRTGTRLMH